MEETMPPVDGTSPEPDEQHLGQADDDEVQQERQRRVQECHVAALAKEDPVQAVLSSINAGLMCIAIRLDQAINENMAVGGPATVEDIMLRHSKPIELQLKLARQIDRLAQLERRPPGKSTERDERRPRAAR